MVTCRGHPTRARRSDQARISRTAGVAERSSTDGVVGPHTVTAKYQPMSPDEEMGKVKPNPLTKEVDAKYSDAQKGALKIEIKGSIDNLELKFD